MIKPDYLFEVSWEVCNKVGGIHTVISTKALTIVNELKDNYILIGPDVWKETSENPEFKEDPYLFRSWRTQAASEGLHIKVGRWKIVGNPIAILVDFTPFFSQKDKIFAEFWENYKLDSLLGQWDYNEPALFGYAAGKVIESFYDYNLSAMDKLVAQFHEWMTGTGILYLKDRVPQAGLLFTTHATILGRTISGNGFPLYKDLNNYKGDITAKNFNVTAKFSLERLSAKLADCFTTVSQITARECSQFLEREVDTITPNGFEDSFVPGPLVFDEKRHEARKKLINVGEALLNQKISDDTILIANSGRYEFRNKGIDLFIDALGKLNKNENLHKNVLAYITVPAAHSGPRQELIDNLEEKDFGQPIQEEYLTHWLLDKNNDPVIKRIHENELMNSPNDKVKIIFVPCYLDGNDGIFEMHYYDLLIGFDLTVFPSYYEPWGYTPLESLAFHIPAVTTTLAGFGIWVKHNFPEQDGGMSLITRTDDNGEQVALEIESFILKFTENSPEKVKHDRQNAFDISRTSLWSNLINQYKEAYSIALTKAEGRSDLFKTKQYKEHYEDITRLRKNKPDWKKVLIYQDVPKSLEALQELSMNLWWSWNYEAEELFELVDKNLWKKLNNPISLLQSLTLEQMRELEDNEEFLKKLKIVYNKFLRYMSVKPDEKDKKIAYFSMEYGLHSSVRIYSGGLGILAGDYMKEASDDNKNFVGIGLLYRYGFFNQKISLLGDQIPEFVPHKFSHLPIKPVRDKDNGWMKVGLALPGRTLYAKIWQLDVGRIPLYLLDTDVDDNTQADHGVTHQLYGGDWENRLKQELLLGVGGIRLLSELKIKPDLYHCNEGHGAFIGLERLRKYIQEEKYPYNEAVEIVRASTLFTTHTPVPAGHDAFSEDLLRAYVPHYASRLNISWDAFMNLGKIHENDPKEKFSMSVLAIKLSQQVNSVSRLHCGVTKQMFSELWDGYYPDELFINYVTNGVHYQTWTNKRWQKLYAKEFDKECFANLSDARFWKNIYKVPDENIWKIRQALRKDLIDEIKRRINDVYTRRNENPKLIFKTIDSIDDNALTIGFARRFATYKRAHLLFHNLERLDSIVNNAKQPVQLIYSGKAHPQDKAGQDLINQIITISKMPQFIGKVIFIENYDMDFAKKMVQGVDVWLNTPTRLKEASGTSGQKAAMNGVLNFSVLDGWWAEGYVPSAGWAIKEEQTYTDEKFQDDLDTEMIYNTLEDEIVPLFYERENDVPIEWVKYIKNCISEVAPHYTTRRMIDEYYSKFYNDLASRFSELSADSYQLIKKLVRWKKKVILSWDSIEVVSMSIPDSTKEPLRLGDDFKTMLTLNLHELQPEDIGVEVIFGQKENDIVKEILFIEEMLLIETHEHTVKFACNMPSNRSGVYDYAFRIYPKNELLPNRQDFSLIKWI
jgi:glycogen phosphorylase/synthase